MRQVKPALPSRLDPIDFHVLQKSLLLSAPRMSKLQLLDLADALHDELRARRGREDQIERSFAPK